MIIPSTRLFTAGEVETGAYLNSAVTNLGNFLLGKPIAFLRQTAAQALTVSGTAYAITFDTEDVDRDNGHSTTTNTSRYTAQTAGWYYLSGGVTFAGNVTGNRSANFYLNGAVDNASGNLNCYLLNTQPCRLLVNALKYLNVGDYVELYGAQSSGGSLNTYVTAPNQSFLTVVWVSS